VPRRLLGIRRKQNGWQALIRIKGQLHQKYFPLETPPDQMRAWREEQLRLYGERPAAPGSFAANVRAYLEKPAIAMMPSIKQRTAHLELWLVALGRDRTAASITREEIEAVLQRWLWQKLSPVTVYHRRTALRSFFVMMNGAEGYNPVTGTTKPKHWLPTDRSVDFATLQRIIDTMPRERSTRPGLREPSLARLRARVLLHTGMPPGELLKLRPQHFDREAARLRMPWRDKGQGTPAYVLPLSAEAVAALVALDAANGWGAFAVGRLSLAFRRAARRVLGKATTVRLYDLRHSLGADLYRRTRDLATVGRLLGHVEGSVVTAQYARGAHTAVDAAAIAAVSADRAAQVAQLARVAPSTKLPRKLPRRRKRRVIKHLRVV